MLLVNAMGGFVDGGVGISSSPSPQQSSDLEKTQSELRQKFTTAEKVRRELEFLQKGGDPLDLKKGSATSVSIQSTSLTDQHPENIVTSEGKYSFAATASPYGDSIGSSCRLGAPSVCEHNSADNLMLFDGDNKYHEIERTSSHPRINNGTPSQHYFQVDVGHNAKESGESAALELPKKSYKRRIRSRPNRALKDAKGLMHHAVNDSQNAQENQNQPLKSDFRDSPPTLDFSEPESLGCAKQGSLSGSERAPYADAETAEDLGFSGQINGFRNTEEERNNIPKDNNIEVALSTKGLDSESSCSQTGQSLDGNNGNELPISKTNGTLNGTVGQILASKEVADMESNGFVAENDESVLNIINNSSYPSHQSQNEEGSAFKEEEGLKGSEHAMQNDLMNPISTKRVDSDHCTTSKTERKLSNGLGSISTTQDENSGRDRGSNDTSFMESTLYIRRSIDVAEQNACSQNNLKLATKEYEDSILEEARIIEAKRRRIAELSAGTLPLEICRKSHWDFVLEEMSWLANDFAQERLWKVTAAAQISRRIAFTSRGRFQQKNSLWEQKEVAHTLAKAVMEFWHTMQVKCKDLEPQCLKKDLTHGIEGYAMKFLENNSSHVQYNAAQAPVTPDRISDLGTRDILSEENLIEGNLFYTVPPGAIEAYKKYMESLMLQYEVHTLLTDHKKLLIKRTGSSMQGEVDTSGYNAVAAFGSQDNTYDEDEGETSTYYLPKSAQKKKNIIRSYSARSYEMGGDLSFMQSVERINGTPPSVLSVKGPSSNINVSIPIKRVRTASRQRVISLFNAGPSGCIQAPNMTDASSGDEQSTLRGGCQIPNNMKAESVGGYAKQIQFDSVEVSNRPKKKKKSKHHGSSFEYRWKHDSKFEDEQDQPRRLENRRFNSNGNTVASQTSNMFNSNKVMKLLVRDSGRKGKALKTPAGQSGSGSPWSLFEDQALVVLVHDMGPNWELISDAINSTLQFKCIFRNSKECQERHRTLMDTNNGAEADSAEDSESSQPYPSTLCGIPEGSARQLFQRLQEPMEEDTLKFHFEKLIKIGKKQQYRTQNNNQDPKQLQQPHSSHTLALSQVSPNNLNGGLVLTPLQLCDTIASSTDARPVGCQGPHSSGLPILHQGAVAPMLPGSGSTSSVLGSSNSVLGYTLSSTSGPLDSSIREEKYGVPRMGSLSVDEQQRIQQYNQMLSSRKMQQSDKGVRMLPSGVKRSMSMARPSLPSFQGIAAPSMLNSGSMLSSGMAVPTPANSLSEAGPGHGNSMLRPRDAMHTIRPNHNTEHQRIMTPDLHMQQVSQSGSTQGVPMFASGMSSSIPNHPAYGMRFIKERQIQQQRLQQKYAMANAMMPNVRPQRPQHPISSPQNSSQIQSQSPSPPVLLSPVGTPSMDPMPQLLAKKPAKSPVPAPNGLVRNPQTGSYQIGKQQQQRQMHPQRQVKVVTEGGRGKVMVHHNLSMDPSYINGFLGGQKAAHIRQVNSSEMSTNIVVPRTPCDDAMSSETPVSSPQWKYDSSGSIQEDATKFGKNSIGTSPPRTSTGTGGELS